MYSILKILIQRLSHLPHHSCHLLPHCTSHHHTSHQARRIKSTFTRTSPYDIACTHLPHRISSSFHNICLSIHNVYIKEVGICLHALSMLHFFSLHL